MIVISFDKWCLCVSKTKKHLYRRIYIKGYIWTPFCKKEKRKAFNGEENTLEAFMYRLIWGDE